MKAAIFFCAALAGLLSGCGSSADPQPGGTSVPGTSTITVKVSEGGAPSYNLAEAKVVSSNYQTGATSLVLSGKLSSGKALVLNFSKGTSTTPNTTNALEATLDGVTATTATGSTTFASQDRTATGTFQATFPVVGAVSGSFASVPVQ